MLDLSINNHIAPQPFIDSDQDSQITIRSHHLRLKLFCKAKTLQQASGQP